MKMSNSDRVDRVVNFFERPKMTTFEEISEYYDANRDLFTTPASKEESKQLIEILKKKGYIIFGDSTL